MYAYVTVKSGKNYIELFLSTFSTKPPWINFVIETPLSLEKKLAHPITSEESLGNFNLEKQFSYEQENES